MTTSDRPPLAGQFRLRELFVLMTVAAVAAWVSSLSLELRWKIFLLMFLWMFFQFWQLLACGRPLTPRDRVNHGVTSIVGQLLMFAMLTSGMLIRGKWLMGLGTSLFLIGLAVLGPAIGIWHAVSQIRQALADARSVSASPPTAS